MNTEKTLKNLISFLEMKRIIMTSDIDKIIVGGENDGET